MSHLQRKNKINLQKESLVTSYDLVQAKNIYLIFCNFEK